MGHLQEELVLKGVLKVCLKSGGGLVEHNVVDEGGEDEGMLWEG